MKQEFSNRILKTTNTMEIAFGRHRNLVIQGIPEPFCYVTKSREGEWFCHVTNVHRLLGLPAHALITRIFGLGGGSKKLEGDARKPPQTPFAELGNPRCPDALISESKAHIWWSYY